jgi:hypothetical protein
LHSLYTAMSHMYAMISLYSYLIPFMIKRVNLVPRNDSSIRMFALV